jgi:hypothetical protein
MLYVVSSAIALGGAGDLTIRRLFAVHTRYLQDGNGGEISARTSSLVIHLLHALGGGLVGVGLAALALVHFGVRRGERWAGLAVLAAVVPSEGMNAAGMWAVGSYWYVSAAYLALAVGGVGLALAGERR